jgi:hypothetical protein
VPDGSVLNKQEVLQDLRTTGLTFHAIELRQSTVRIYGPTAVLTGSAGSGEWTIKLLHESINLVELGLAVFPNGRLPVPAERQL